MTMSDKDTVGGSIMEGAAFTVEQICTVIAVEREWIVRHVEEGLFTVSGTSITEWRFSSADLRRAERMRTLERNFDAAPELAALFADLQEEMDELRARLRRAGLG
jgi:chaperone modulatory protein CbpM